MFDQFVCDLLGFCVRKFLSNSKNNLEPLSLNSPCMYIYPTSSFMTCLKQKHEFIIYHFLKSSVELKTTKQSFWKSHYSKTFLKLSVDIKIFQIIIALLFSVSILKNLETINIFCATKGVFIYQWIHMKT